MQQIEIKKIKKTSLADFFNYKLEAPKLKNKFVRRLVTKIQLDCGNCPAFENSNRNKRLNLYFECTRSYFKTRIKSSGIKIDPYCLLGTTFWAKTSTSVPFIHHVRLRMKSDQPKILIPLHCAFIFIFQVG